MVSDGEIDESTGEQLKADWYGITFFYPSFQRVMQQYENIQEDGGEFIYDTGYLYFFGRINDDYLIDLLLLSLCMVIRIWKCDGNGIPEWFMVFVVCNETGKKEKYC